MNWADEEETVCSTWYRSNIEKTHQHFWVERPHCRRTGIPGLYGGFACYAGGEPITGLSRTVQIEIYEHFEDPREAKELFMVLGQSSGRTPHMWNALQEWIENGYPGTWRDWWERKKQSGNT